METTPAEIAAAFRIEDESRIGFWDALIISSAVKSGCSAHKTISKILIFSGPLRLCGEMT